jgi:hypothetical protein
MRIYRSGNGVWDGRDHVPYPSIIMGSFSMWPYPTTTWAFDGYIPLFKMWYQSYSTLRLSLPLSAQPQVSCLGYPGLC